MEVVKSAAEAIQRRRFEPARCGGEPVTVEMPVAVESWTTDREPLRASGTGWSAPAEISLHKTYTAIIFPSYPRPTLSEVRKPSTLSPLACADGPLYGQRDKG